MDLILQGVSCLISNEQREGDSDEEIVMFEELLHSNAHLLYRYAENGGI